MSEDDSLEDRLQAAINQAAEIAAVKLGCKPEDVVFYPIGIDWGDTGSDPATITCTFNYEYFKAKTETNDDRAEQEKDPGHSSQRPLLDSGEEG